MPATDFLDQSLLQIVFGGIGYAAPTTLYVGLSSSVPTQYQSGSINWNFLEPSGNGYTRASISASSFAAAETQPSSGFLVGNTASIAFPVSTGPWLGGVALPYHGVWDSESNGNLLGFGPVYPSVSVPGAGYILAFAVQQLQVAAN